LFYEDRLLPIVCTCHSGGLRMNGYTSRTTDPIAVQLRQGLYTACRAFNPARSTTLVQAHSDSSQSWICGTAGSSSSSSSDQASLSSSASPSLLPCCRTRKGSPQSHERTHPRACMSTRTRTHTGGHTRPCKSMPASDQLRGAQHHDALKQALLDDVNRHDRRSACPPLRTSNFCAAVFSLPTAECLEHRRAWEVPASGTDKPPVSQSVSQAGSKMPNKSTTRQFTLPALSARSRT
jgi:hypothetical protein